jgi:hypothetical protein
MKATLNRRKLTLILVFMAVMFLARFFCQGACESIEFSAERDQIRVERC